MKKTLIEKEITAVVSNYTQVVEHDFEKSLSLFPYCMDARELTMIFLEVENKFGVDINKLFDEISNFSIRTIVDAVELQIK